MNRTAGSVGRIILGNCGHILCTCCQLSAHSARIQEISIHRRGGAGRPVVHFEHGLVVLDLDSVSQPVRHLLDIEHERVPRHRPERGEREISENSGVVLSETSHGSPVRERERKRGREGDRERESPLSRNSPEVPPLPRSGLGWSGRGDQGRIASGYRVKETRLRHARVPQHRLVAHPTIPVSHEARLLVCVRVCWLGGWFVGLLVGWLVGWLVS